MEIEDYKVIRLDNPMDFNQAGVLTSHVEKLINEGHKNIALDAADVVEIGSMGIGAIISVSQMIRSQHGMLKIIGVRNQLHNAFRVGKVDTAFELHFLNY